jgi:hypothetical protein
VWLLAYSNRKYAPDSSDDYPGAARDRALPTVAGLARFCGRTARELLPLGVRHFELWNEQNLFVFMRRHDGTEVRAADYYPYLEACHEAVHAEARRLDRPATLLAGGLVSSGCDPVTRRRCPAPWATPRNPVRWTRELYAFRRDHRPPGTPMPFDAYALHPYNWLLPSPLERSPMNALTRQAADIARLLRRGGDGDVRLWATEYGWVSRPRSTMSLAVSRTRQARYLGVALRHWWSRPWAGPMFVYALRDRFDDDDPRAHDWESNWGVLEHDFTPKRAWHRIGRLLRDPS